MTYNVDRNRQLLKRSYDLKNKKKDLSIENKKELSEYNIRAESYIYWQYRHKIGSSMKDFLTKKIDGEELSNIVFGVCRNSRIKFEKFKLQLISGSEKIKNFQPDPRSRELSRFFTGLYCDCDDFLEDYENEEFYNYIKNHFLYLEEVLNKELYNLSLFLIILYFILITQTCPF